NSLLYFFDFLSPFSYFSWQPTLALAQKFGLPLEIRPVSLGVLLNHWGQKGPAEIAPKREFLLRQCLRYAQIHQIPFTSPRFHPFNPLYALRMSLQENAGEWQPRVISALWKHGWQDGH